MTSEAGRPVSNTFRNESYKQSTKEAFIVLVTLTHADLTDDIRVCSDGLQLLPIAGVRGVVSNGLEYVFLPFSLGLPSQDDTGISKASISVDNVDRSIVQAVRDASTQITVSIKVILASAPDNVEISFDNFELDRVSYDAFTVSGELSMEYFDLEPFPKARFTPSYFAGIF